MAFYAVGCLAGVAALKACQVCCNRLCEKPDDWKIDTEARPGELGAGWMYKRGKGAAIWSKRFFVLTEHKLDYYTDEDRMQLKGSILLAGAVARQSSTRANAHKKFYFTVAHPECGIREFYTKSVIRRTQWLDRINDASSKLHNRSHYGKLLKQGEFNKSNWRERWCVCTGHTFEYYENATETVPKGTIDLVNAKIREYSTKDQKFCFEIVGTGTEGTEKKASKKYIFAAEKDHHRAKWVEVLRTISDPQSQASQESGEGSNDTSSHSIYNENFSASSSVNPMQASDSSKSQQSQSQSQLQSPKQGGTPGAASSQVFRIPTKPTFEEKQGYLEKKSPSLMAGWQKRWFALKSSGEIFYYEKEKDCLENMQPKGVISVEHLFSDGSGAKVFNKREVHFRQKERVYELRARDAEDAASWVRSVSAAISVLHGQSGSSHGDSADV